MRHVKSILVTTNEVLVDDGKGTVEHLKPEFIKILMQNGEVRSLRDLHIDVEFEDLQEGVRLGY